MKSYCLSILAVMLGSFVLFALSELENIGAQQGQPGNLTKIIEEKFPINIDKFLGIPVEVDYESLTTILISGKLLTSLQFNTQLWSAMDMLRNQYGFKIQQVMTSGVGSVGNPTTVYILMTK